MAASTFHAAILLGLLASLLPAALGATLTCTNVTSASFGIASVADAGQHDVSCAGFATWYVYVVGCGNSGSSSWSSVVSIRLLDSPTQVVVSDNTTMVSANTTMLPLDVVNASLAGCSVDVTFASDTAVPADATLPHVYVSTASAMGNVAVTLLAALHLEGSFVAITGNNSGGIASVALRSEQGSSIVCRRASNASYEICSPRLGTSLVTLALGCPQIGALAVTLNGTNVGGSTWEATASTSRSSFSLVIVENTTRASITPPPRRNDIVVSDVHGLVVSALVAVRV
jgi:hypothetical protein